MYLSSIEFEGVEGILPIGAIILALMLMNLYDSGSKQLNWLIGCPLVQLFLSRFLSMGGVSLACLKNLLSRSTFPSPSHPFTIVDLYLSTFKAYIDNHFLSFCLFFLVIGLIGNLLECIRPVLFLSSHLTWVIQQ